jgi:transcriptional regulator GlxA family with amidase domain
VGAIARRHGFVQMSSFAARFRESYGLTPSQLLRRSRLNAG